MKLKSQNEYRRLKKPFIFILSIILTLSICSLEGFKKPFEASTYATTYGSYSFDNKNFNLVITNNYLCTFAYSLNGEYNGRMNINFNLNYNSLSPQPAIIPINCYIESFNGTSITIAFKNQNEIGFLIVGSNVSSLAINSISNYNMTKITDGTNTQLQSMSIAISDIETTINNIYTLMSTTNTNVSSINTNVNDIENLLRTYFTDNNGVTINIGDIVLQFNEFNAQLQLQLGILNDLKTALLDIDNKIDSISWNNIAFKGITTDFSTFNSSYTQQTLNNNTYVAFNQTNEFTRGHANVRLFKLTIPAYAGNNDYKVYFNSNANTKYEVNIMLAQKTRGTLNVYFTLEGSSVWGNLYPSIVWNGATIYTSPAPTLQYIDNNDIEYWNIYNIIQNYNYKISIINKLNELKPINYNTKLDDIINSINDLNMSVTNTTVNDTQVNIENYNDIMTDIESIEVNFNTQFNTSSNSISQESINAPTFNQERQLLTKVTNELVMSNNKMKYIVYIILLGFVVIRILG